MGRGIRDLILKKDFFLTKDFSGDCVVTLSF